MEYDIDADASATVRTVDWHMMDKQKLYPMATVSGLTIRMIIHPISVVRTRIQNQRQSSLYTGTWDAVVKIHRAEGVRSGFYRGFWVTMPYLGVHLWYLTALERTKQFAAHLFPAIKNHYGLHNALAGGIAGGTTQLFTVPIDVVSQHLMVAGDSKHSHLHLPQPKFGPGTTVVEKQHFLMRRFISLLSQIWCNDGMRGFYKGFFPSCVLYGTNSAFFWFFYENYVEGLEFLNRRFPWLYRPLLRKVSDRDHLPNLLLRCCSAPAAGVTTSFFVNWLDVIRVRNQVHGTAVVDTVAILWREEGLFNTLTKGLSARMLQSFISAPLIMLGYELVKRLSALPEYKNKIRW